MTDAPEGPAGAQPERGSGRRSPRVGDSSSPVGSTLSIILAVVAVVAGFLILRAITDDDDDTSGIIPDTTSEPGESTVPGADGVDVGGSTVPNVTATTLPAHVVTGATVSVANASGVSGSAAGMTTALQGAGYTTGEAGNNTGAQLEVSVVYFTAGDAAAQAVAESIARDLGGVQSAPMPTPPPIDVGLGTSTVLVMVGVDTAGKTLADLSATAVTSPAVAGAVTTTT